MGHHFSRFLFAASALVWSQPIVLAGVVGDRHVYPDTSLTSCPEGERLEYFFQWQDMDALRGPSWCGAAEASVAWSNATDPQTWRRPYLLESCIPGVAWFYSHALLNGGRYYSPAVRDISMVCIVEPPPPPPPPPPPLPPPIQPPAPPGPPVPMLPPPRPDDGTGTVSAPGQERCDAGLATPNPILASVGVKLLALIDFDDSAPHSLRLTRYYASRWNRLPDARLSTNWSHSYAHRIVGQGDERVVHFGNGGESRFVLDESGSWRAAGGLDVLSELPQGWLLTRAEDDSRWLFASDTGLVVRVTQRNGWAHEYTYSDGKLSQVANAFGRTLHFSYDLQGRLSMIEAPDGEWVLYEYDERDRLYTATRSDNVPMRYEYEDERWTAALTGVTHLGRRTTYAYDGSGRPTSSEQPGGTGRYAVTYGDNAAAITDPLAMTRSYVYATPGGPSAGHRMLQASEPAMRGNPVAMQAFDALGLLQLQQDFVGVETTYSWDPDRRLPVGQVRAANRPEAQARTTQWHPQFSLPTRSIQGPREKRWEYDAAGNMLREEIRDTQSGDLRARAWTYEDRGLVLTHTDARGGLWRFAHDSLGNLAAVVDPLGRQYQYSHDARGRLLAAQAPAGRFDLFVNDVLGRPQIIWPGSDGPVVFEWLASDVIGRITGPDGWFAAYGYDAAARLTEARDSHGTTRRFALDAAGNAVQDETSGVEGTVGKRLSRSFTALGRLAAVQGAAGQTTTFGYDGNGSLLEMLDPLQHRTGQTLDGLQRPIATSFPDGAAATQTWDVLGNITEVTDPRNVATRYVLNAFGEVMSQANADAGPRYYTRNAAGDVLSVLDANGNVLRIERDLLGRVVRTELGPGQVVTFAYNDGDEIARFEDTSGSTSYLRNDRARVTSKTQVIHGLPGSLAVTYGLEYGKLSELSYPSGLRVRYPRTAGRIGRVEVREPGSGRWLPFVNSIAYSPLGQPRSWLWAAGPAAAREFDADGRMTASEFARYTYDAASRIAGITQMFAGAGEAEIPIEWTVRHDSRDRITGFSRSGNETHFTYDGNTNRLSAIERSVDAEQNLEIETRQDAAIDSASNRLLGLTHTVVTKYAGTTRSVVVTPVAHQLDANGNLVGDGERIYEYDATNRLVAVSEPGPAAPTVARYRHNALGQRVYKQTGSGASQGTAYVYADGDIPDWALLGEYKGADAASQGAVEYIWLPTEDGGAILIGMYRDRKFHSVHTDHLGTPRQVRDSRGSLVWQWPYDAFGKDRPIGLARRDSSGAMIHSPPDIEFNLRFPGQYFDWETGTHYNRWRDYDPVTGRYRQADPTGLTGGLNGYSYVEGNPLSMADPMGLMGGSGSGAGARRGAPTVSGFGCMGLACATGGTHDSGPQFSAELSFGGGIEICDPPPPPKPDPETCGKNDGGFYGTTGRPQVQPPGVPVPKRFGGAFFGPSWKANGQFCLRIGPHVSVPFVPSADLGGLRN